MTFKVKEKHGPGVAEAFKMLDTFASVGVEAFDITHTNIDEEKRGFRRGQSLQETRRSMPFLLDSAPRRQNNVIIRPHHLSFTVGKLGFTSVSLSELFGIVSSALFGILFGYGRTDGIVG